MFIHFLKNIRRRIVVVMPVIFFFFNVGSAQFLPYDAIVDLCGKIVFVRVDTGGPSHAQGGQLSCSFSGQKDTFSRVFADHLRRAGGALSTVCTDTTSHLPPALYQPLSDSIGTGIALFQAYCLLDDSLLVASGTGMKNTTLSVAEAIKIATKIATIGSGVSFDELGWYPGRLPYRDMTPNAWYTPYVLFAHTHGYLDGVIKNGRFGRGSLRPLSPITKKQLSRLVQNVGSTGSVAAYLHSSGKYVTKIEVMSMFTELFAHKFGDYAVLYGNNMTFYRWFLGVVTRAPEQFLYAYYLTSFIDQWDRDFFLWKYNLDLDGIVLLLRGVLATY